MTEDDYLFDDVQLRVLTATGWPRQDIDVDGSWRTNTCGGGRGMGRSDSKGGPYSAGDPEGDAKSRDLTDNELRELFVKHKVTIRWWYGVAALGSV